jgi:hypothetical protein
MKETTKKPGEQLHPKLKTQFIFKNILTASNDNTLEITQSLI